MTNAQARQRVLKALVALGCRGARNSDCLTPLFPCDRGFHVAFCHAIAGQRWHLLSAKLFRCDLTGLCGVQWRWVPEDARGEDVRTIGDLIEAVRAAYPL